MSTSQVAAAHAQHKRKAALRTCADPDRLGRALRAIGAALDLGVLTLDQVIAAREDHRRQGAR